MEKRDVIRIVIYLFVAAAMNAFIINVPGTTSIPMLIKTIALVVYNVVVAIILMFVCRERRGRRGISRPLSRRIVEALEQNKCVKCGAELREETVEINEGTISILGCSNPKCFMIYSTDLEDYKRDPKYEPEPFSSYTEWYEHLWRIWHVLMTVSLFIREEWADETQR